MVILSTKFQGKSGAISSYSTVLVPVPYPSGELSTGETSSRGSGPFLPFHPSSILNGSKIDINADCYCNSRARSTLHHLSGEIMRPPRRPVMSAKYSVRVQPKKYQCPHRAQFGSHRYVTVRITYNEGCNVIMTVTGSASQLRGSEFL